jgi:hypothetical protein
MLVVVEGHVFVNFINLVSSSTCMFTFSFFKIIEVLNYWIMYNLDYSKLFWPNDSYKKKVNTHKMESSVHFYSYYYFDN